MGRYCCSCSASGRCISCSCVKPGKSAETVRLDEIFLAETVNLGHCRHHSRPTPRSASAATRLRHHPCPTLPYSTLQRRLSPIPVASHLLPPNAPRPPSLATSSSLLAEMTRQSLRVRAMSSIQTLPVVVQLVLFVLLAPPVVPPRSAPLYGTHALPRSL